MKRIILSFIIFLCAFFAQAQKVYWYPISGTNTYTVNISSYGTSYQNGCFHGNFANPNSGAATVNVNNGSSSLGAKAIRKWDGDSWEALVSGDIKAPFKYRLCYDNSGDYFELETVSGSSSTPSLVEVLDAGNVIDNVDKSISVSNDGTFSIGAPPNPTALQFTGAGTIAFTLGSDAPGDMWRRSSTGIIERRTPTQVRTDISAQPLATILTDLSGLSPSNDDVFQFKAGAITNRSISQLKTDIGNSSGSTTGLLSSTDYSTFNAKASATQLQKNVSATTYTILSGDNDYLIHFTNASGCTVTIDAALATGTRFTGRRATGAGDITFASDGTSVLNTIGGELSIEIEEGWATWIKSSTANNWDGTGALGPGGGGSTGTVTSVSVLSANGFAGSVATATTTPALTITTSITGLLKGNGTAISAASGGTDYEVPLTFSTGLTRATNTITVNTSQNIATLSNLTSNGLVTTSGGTGSLSVTIPGSGILTFLGTPSSANLFSALTTKTGSGGSVVFATGPTMTDPVVGTQTAGDNSTKAASTAFVQAAISGTAVMFFGDGNDGDLTVTTNNETSGPITSGVLTRDAYFNNLTISGSGSIRTDGYKLFVKGILDISAAGADAITANGRAPGNGANSGTGGTASAAIVAGTVGGTPVARNGGAGNLTAGSTATSSVSANISNGGGGGTGRTGGSGLGGTNSGGAASIGGTILKAALIARYTDTFLLGPDLLVGGTAGGGGGGGGGDGTVSGGGAGSGGSGGGPLIIIARTINRSGSTTAGAISAKGGAGGNGGSPASGNAGGGAGGGGGGGGWPYIFYFTLTGSTATNCIDASGGNGGNGGNGIGTGTGGRGGDGGSGGRIDLINGSAQTGVHTFGTAGAASSTVSGTSGTTGGAGDTEQSNL